MVFSRFENEGDWRRMMLLRTSNIMEELPFIQTVLYIFLKQRE